MPDEPALMEVVELRKVFRIRKPGSGRDDLVAVNNVSFSVHRGRSLAIVGESGSGKSTIARVIVGLERATAGRIVVGGDDRSKVAVRASERRKRGRQVQIVFQDPYSSLDPAQRVADSLNEVLRLHFDMSSAERRRRVAELLDHVDLDDVDGRALPRALSGGQRQRVAIARALAAQPLVLILDEAVSALDVSIQAGILNRLSDLREEQQMTFILISHDLAVVRQLTEEALVMRHGEVVERGSTGTVLDFPQHEYTRLLRDSVPRPGWKPQRRLGAELTPASDAVAAGSH